MDLLKQFAESAPSETAHQEGLLDVLGIDVGMLTFQVIAFLLLLFLLGKLVFPWLLKAVDERQEKIEASVKMASESQMAAEDTKKHIEKLLKKAHSEAKDIVSVAKSEASEIVKDAEKKAQRVAEQITQSAKEQIDKDILAAKKSLKAEMLSLVAQATEKIVTKSVSDEIDENIISQSIEELK